MYSAIITSIKKSEHPNAERLAIGHCKGFTVVISKDIEEGQLGAFFPSDGKLSTEFCIQNNLYPVLDDQGKRIGGGFFDRKNSRVRAQAFRGVQSEGFWCPLSYFDYLPTKAKAQLVEGFEFTSIDGIEICDKWINPATLRAIKNQQGKKVVNQRETPFLLMHSDTDQLKYKLDQIPVGARITLTSKCHGTSGRSGFSLEKVKQSIINLPYLRDIFYRDVEEWVWRNGTRRVLVESFKDIRSNSFYGNEEFRYLHEKVLKYTLPKNVAVYYEVVGYTTEGKLIMPEVDCTQHSKEFVKQYGKTMSFTYGCSAGQSKMYIYNVVLTTDDEHRFTLNYEQLKAFCIKHGLDVVPQLYPTFTYDGDTEELKALCDSFSVGADVLDSSHIREGICLMIEYNGEVTFLKNKSADFYILEGIMKSSDAVDMEELESYQ